MQPQLLLIAVGVAVALPLFLWLQFHGRREDRGGGRWPPSPPSWPLLGHLWYVLFGKEPPHVLLYKLSRQHGLPLMWLRLGQQRVIVASTPAAARSILQAQDSIFAGRPRLEVPVQLHGCADILFASPSDPHWKFLRHLLSSHFFSKKIMEAFEPVRAQEIRALLSACYSDAVPVQERRAAVVCMSIRAHAHALTSNIMCRMAFGKRLPELASAGHVDWHFRLLIQLVTDMNDLLQVFSVADYFPFLAPMDVQGHRKQTRALARRFDAVLQDIIDARIRERKASAHGASAEEGGSHPDGNPDFLDVLLQSASLSTGETASPLSKQNVKAALMNVLGGGIDTAALTIEWALAELLANPSKMGKLQEELAEVVGMARLVEESDIPSLPYLQAVVKETMRLHPAGPLLAPHSASKACEVMGYEIPANTIAYINVWAIGRDPSTWERPLQFLPERFEGKDMDVNGKYFELLAFGAGRRGCPGWMLGLTMVQMAVAGLVQAFEWELAKELDVCETSGLLLTSSTPLLVKASPRVAPQLFQTHDSQRPWEEKVAQQ